MGCRGGVPIPFVFPVVFAILPSRTSAKLLRQHRLPSSDPSGGAGTGLNLRTCPDALGAKLSRTCPLPVPGLTDLPSATGFRSFKSMWAAGEVF